ncbi:MAG: hypothetical protein LBV42_06135, partial [Methanobrevibacter sp.]|nr:hypothetical protein [Methanobrevibacter sp.]
MLKNVHEHVLQYQDGLWVHIGPKCKSYDIYIIMDQHLKQDIITCKRMWFIISAITYYSLFINLFEPLYH